MCVLGGLVACYLSTDTIIYNLIYNLICLVNNVTQCIFLVILIDIKVNIVKLQLYMVVRIEIGFY